MSAQYPNRLRIAVLVAALIVAIPAAANTPSPEAPASPADTSGADSRETRNELTELLRRCPPQLASVLKLDPTLLADSSYLATYPELAAFAARHPEIAHHPDYFFANVGLTESHGEYASAGIALDILAGIMGFSIFLVVTGVLGWLVKTLIAQRRWSRLSRVQTEVHTKLLDRLASSDELLTYIQSTAGRRFLESAPIPVDDGKPALGAPVGRILGSVQAGVVIAAAGIGLQLISRGLPQDIARPIFSVGIFAICVGLGFVLAAIISFVVSRKLGLWPPPAAAAGRDVDA